MTDVIKIAKTHRDRLKAEINKIDEFIAMAEELSRRGDSEAHTPLKQAAAAAATKAEEPTIELARRSTNGAAAN